MKETLILIPGFANNQRAWAFQAEGLKDYFDVSIFVMDRFSSREEMVDYVLQKAPEHFYIAGHSMGGWIAQGIAAKAPQRVRKLLLFNTWANLDPQMMFMQRQVCQALKDGQLAEVMQQQLSSLIHPSRLQNVSLIQSLQTMIVSFSLDTLVRQLEAMLSDDSSLHLHSSILAPALIVHSRQDVLFPREHEKLQSGLKHSIVTVIEECGHASILEKPEETMELIRSFLKN